jgi:hypothetical protein
MVKKWISSIVLLIILSSCQHTVDNGQPNTLVKKLDNKILYDSEGNAYFIRHSINDAYFISPLDSTELKNPINK